MAIQGNPVVGLSPEGQALAAWPDVTRRKSSVDGMESSGHAMERAQLDGLNPTADENGVYGDPQLPTLATVNDPQLIFRTIDGLARGQERMVSNRWAIDLYCRRTRANIPFSYLEKLPNVAQYVAKLPNGVTRERAGSTPNKADDLCNKVESTLEADPMRPNPIAHTDSEEAEQAQALCGEYLRSVMGESGINWEEKHHWAVNVALTCGSSFLHYDVDADGGGYQPYQILAHPQAQDAANPKVAVNPETGFPEPTVDPVLRYVSAPTPESPAGQFVDDASQADIVWLPAPTCDRIRREQVRLIPADADVDTARGAILCLWCTVADGMRKWPETVGKMNATELASIASWRPSIGQDIVVPFALRAGMGDGSSGPSVDEVGTFSPLLQRRMFYYRFYAASSREYKGGFQVDTTGYQSGYTLGSKSLEYQVKLPKGGTETRCREIPLEQIRPCQDVDGGDPMGWAFLHRIAGSSETEQMLYAAYQDAINLRLNPHVFIRSTVAVDDEDWADRSTPIIIDPTDPEPTYEQFPAMPPFLDMIENVDRKMDSSASLGETGQNLQTSTAVSGVAKQITVQQANKDLSGMLQQLNAGKTRGCRILVQIAQAEFTVPQLMEYTGEDGSIQTEWWTGENLAGIDDIGIEPGTGTTMTPEGKAQLAQFAQGAGWLSQADAAKVGLMGVSRDLGLPPDPIMEAVERSVGTWLKGPPQGWEEENQQLQPALQAYAQAQQQFAHQSQAYQQSAQNTAIVAGGPPPINLGPESQNAQAMDSYQQAVIALQLNPLAPTPPQPPQGPPPPKPWSPFIDRPNDTEPGIASKWMQRLSLAQMSPEYTRWSPAWRGLLDQRYTMVRQAVATASGAQAQLPNGGKQGQASQPNQPHDSAPGQSGPQTIHPTLPNQGPPSGAPRHAA